MPPPGEWEHVEQLIASHTLTSSKRNYVQLKKEVLLEVKNCDEYRYGKKFIHQPQTTQKVSVLTRLSLHYLLRDSRGELSFAQQWWWSFKTAHQNENSISFRSKFKIGRIQSLSAVFNSTSHDQILFRDHFWLENTAEELRHCYATGTRCLII